MKQALTLIILIASIMSCCAAPQQWTTASGGNGHFYDLILMPQLSWHLALEEASGLSYNGSGGYLATLVTSAEQSAVVSMLGGGSAVNECWVGGYQDKNDPAYSELYGGWKWITGEAWVTDANASSYSFNNNYWNIDSEEYLITWWNTGGLNDCSTIHPARGFLVEYEPNCNAAVPEFPSSILAAMGGLSTIIWRRRSK